MDFSDAFRARYEILRPLGQGGMGQVLLARRKADSQGVAIKTILAGCFADDEARARFLSEAKIPGKLSHTKPWQAGIYNVTIRGHYE